MKYDSPRVQAYIEQDVEGARQDSLDLLDEERDGYIAPPCTSNNSAATIAGECGSEASEQVTWFSA